MTYNEACRALCAGSISFAQFTQHTRSLWSYMAARLMQRWPPGYGVSQEDVTQDLLVAAWEAFGQYNPTRGVPVNRYVLFNAIDKAKKNLHRSRGAGQERDHGLTRVPLPGVKPVEETLARRAGVLVEIEKLLDNKRALEHYMAGLNREDRLVMESLVAGGCASAAAMLIYNRYQDRLRLRLGSEGAAQRYVEKVLERLGTNHPLA